MRNSKLFRNQLNIVVVIFISLFQLFISGISTDASTCVPGGLIDFKIHDRRKCPRSQLLCIYEIWEEKRANPVCEPGQIATTTSECRIRDREDPQDPFWNWPIFGNSLRGPCFEVIGSAPNTSEYEVTIWFQYVMNLGSGAACEITDCFFCEDYNNDGEISIGLPECGLENKTCPD